MSARKRPGFEPNHHLQNRLIHCLKCIPSHQVYWFNNRRLPEPISNIPLTEIEEQYYDMPDDVSTAAELKPDSLRQTRCNSQWASKMDLVYLAISRSGRICIKVKLSSTLRQIRQEK